MTSKEEYLLETWPKQQAKGKPMYVVSYVLLYSAIVGIVSLLFRVDDGPVMDVIVSTEFLVKLAIFATIGLVIAHYKWKANNKKYEALKRQRDEQPNSQL